MGVRVEAVRTPISAQELSPLLQGAWLSRFGVPVEPKVLALLLALADLETGDGVPPFGSMPNAFHHNYGNIIIAARNLPTSVSDHFVLRGDEGPGTGSNAAEHHYRVFNSPEDGALGLVTQLTRESRQQWWDGLLTGDPETFVRALNGQFGGPKYFEAAFDRYLDTFLRRWQSYRVNDPTPPPVLPQPQPEPTRPKAKPRKPGPLLPLALVLGGWALHLWASKRSARGALALR